jgi:hypothetical protein
MNKALTLFFILFFSFQTYAQRNAVVYNDTLAVYRNFMQTDIYQKNQKLRKSTFSALLRENRTWHKKNRIANIILPAGPFMSLGGIYMAYDAIKGVPMVYVEDGVEYPYVIRSLPGLLGGLAAFVTGLSLMESANETKTNAANWYNKQVKPKQETAIYLKIGLTESGGIGLTANF